MKRAQFLKSVNAFRLKYHLTPETAVLHPADFVLLLADCLKDFPGVSGVDEFEPFSLYGVECQRDHEAELGKIVFEGAMETVLVVELEAE